MSRPMERRLFCTSLLFSGAGFFLPGCKRKHKQRKRSLSKFKPTTDIHHHLDAMTPRAIMEVSNRCSLEWAEKTLKEIKNLSQVRSGVTWEEWYAAHSRARKAVFVKPEVFEHVASEAVKDAELEGLQVRVMRFSLSMAKYCFIGSKKRKPDLNNPKDRNHFLSLFDETIEYLSRGIAKGSAVKTPLVFSVSCGDAYLPVIDDVANIVLSHRKTIAGIDLTNEQVHRLPTYYAHVISRIRENGIEALTIHTGNGRHLKKRRKENHTQQRNV